MPKHLEALPLKICLHSLQRRDTGAAWLQGEPYLWLIFLKVDGSVVVISPEFKLLGEAEFYFTEGSHGNLGMEASKNHRVKIPKNIGEWQTTLTPFYLPHFEQAIPSVVGVAAILMEQNNMSYQGAEAGHQALNNYIQKAVNEVIAEFSPQQINVLNLMESLKKYFVKAFEKHQNQIMDTVINAVKNKQSILQNLWTLVNKDNLIGFHVQVITHLDFEQTDKFMFSHRWKTKEHGEWEVMGTAEIMPPETSL